MRLSWVNAAADDRIGRELASTAGLMLQRRSISRELTENAPKQIVQFLGRREIQRCCVEPEDVPLGAAT